MFDLKLLTLAGKLADHTVARQSLIAENVANADTPGYSARDLPDFAETVDGRDRFALRRTDPRHIGGGSLESIARPVDPQFVEESQNGNTVSIEGQMLASAANKHDHDLALAVYGKSLTILRLSVGRR